MSVSTDHMMSFIPFKIAQSLKFHCQLSSSRAPACLQQMNAKEIFNVINLDFWAVLSLMPLCVHTSALIHHPLTSIEYPVGKRGIIIMHFYGTILTHKGVSRWCSKSICQKLWQSQGSVMVENSKTGYGGKTVCFNSELKVLNRFIRPVFLKLWVATKKWVTGLSLMGPRVAKLDSSKVLFF